MTVVVATAAPGCARQADRPVAVSLATLATYQEAYQGKQVRTEGVVRMFEPPRHCGIEDDQSTRVALEPVARVAPLLGWEVRVVGRFRFDDRMGRVIEVKEIAPWAASSISSVGGR